MTDEHLAKLEKMRADVSISAAAEIFQHFPEIAKDLREARAEIERLRCALAHQEALVDMFEPLALASCKTPPKRCKCEGCVYRREWENSNK